MDGARRRKLWELGPAYMCCLVGTCLPVKNLRRLARRAGLAQAHGCSDYELHRAAVHLASQRNDFSRAAHKELEARFSAAIARFMSAKDEAQLLELWRIALAGGEVAGALWALMTHPLASEALIQLVSQDMHMLSHQAGAESRADLRRLGELERENRELRARLEARHHHAARELAAKESRIAALKQRLAEATGLRLRLDEAEERARSLQAPASSAPPLHAHERRLAESEARCERLEGELAALRRERDAAERALQDWLPRSAAPSRGPELSGRRVLYVGGRTRLVEQYRELVARHGGELLHHDGGIEESLKRLQPLLGASDMVVVAAGETSHAAYYIVKRFCKHAAKPCVLLRRASVTSLLGALRALAGERPLPEGDTLLRTAA